MLTVVVEFTGLSKVITGTAQTTLTMPKGSSYRDLIRHLAEIYPPLIGILIAGDGETFLSSNMFIIDGDYANPAMVINDPIKDGEHLHLMSVITGG
jgi:hypothetical protein